MNAREYHDNYVEQSRENAIRQSAPCPVCEKSVHPDYWRQHFDVHHPGETVLPFPARLTLEVIDRETGEITPARSIMIDAEFKLLIPALSDDERAGCIQPGNEEETIHINDGYKVVKEAIELKSKIHKQLARDIKVQERIQQLEETEVENTDYLLRLLRFEINPELAIPQQAA